MSNKRVYINGMGCVSPQQTVAHGDGDRSTTVGFLAEPLASDTNQLRCLDPGYRDFIPADMIRRMGRIIKMGVAASKLCCRDAAASRNNGTGELVPEAIITGTGMGCLEDTEKFLTTLIKNNEEFLTPTSFIQSTHNTVAGQIALLLKCHGYNFTYVHRGVSFESALIDAMTQMELGELSNVLAGGMDELTANYFAITSRLGHWKQKPIHSLNLLQDHQRGSIAGEGATFLFLENEKNAGTYAELSAVKTFLKPSSGAEISQKLHDFLSSCGLTIKDIDLVLLGLNGDDKGDRSYLDLVPSDFGNTSLAYFKHLCGEYHTASAFACWIGAMVLKTQSVPGVIRFKGTPSKLNRVLIYNHFQGANHAFILLSHP
jgi:3-oxoacyl-(acyl-carrier-protein) synthase